MLVRGADELGLVSSSWLQRGALVGLPVLNITMRTDNDIKGCELYDDKNTWEANIKQPSLVPTFWIKQRAQ